MNKLTKTKTSAPAPAPSAGPDPDFQNLVNLLAVYTEAHNQLAACQNQANEQMLEILDDIKPDYAALQSTITKTEAALETICLLHPDWFTEKRTIRTAFGTVKLSKSPPHLVVSNEELTLLLVKQLHGQPIGAPDPETGEPQQLFSAPDAIRIRETLNLEYLAQFDEATLARLRITRAQDHTFTAKPATLDLGKSVRAEKEPA